LPTLRGFLLASELCASLAWTAADWKSKSASFSAGKMDKPLIAVRATGLKRRVTRISCGEERRKVTHVKNVGKIMLSCILGASRLYTKMPEKRLVENSLIY